MVNDSEEAYTKTRAYNFLKDLLGLSKKDFVNKKFFSLFFYESEGFYIIKRPEDLIKMMFTEEGIVELNKMYYQKKQEKNPEAELIANRIMHTVQTVLAA